MIPKYSNWWFDSWFDWWFHWCSMEGSWQGERHASWKHISNSQQQSTSIHKYCKASRHASAMSSFQSPSVQTWDWRRHRSKGMEQKITHWHTLYLYLSPQIKMGGSQCVSSHETSPFVVFICWWMVFLPTVDLNQGRDKQRDHSHQHIIEVEDLQKPGVSFKSLFTLVHSWTFCGVWCFLDGVWCLIPFWPGSGCWSSPNLCPPSEGWTPPTDHQRAAPHHATGIHGPTQLWPISIATRGGYSTRSPKKDHQQVQ